MGKLDLSIVILSYNTKDITDECLMKLKKSVNFCEKKIKNKIEVIVVDNNSSDGSASMIGRKHPWVKLIESKENTGFSKGNNIGMGESKYSYILLLNSDCYVDETTLFDALTYFEENKSCDVLGAKLILPDGNVQISTGYLYNPINTFFWISGLPFSRPIHPKTITNEVKEVEWVMGAFFMLKREVYEKTGGFDENIFMYGEEVEWSRRIRDSGFKVFYVPKVVARHLDKASSKGISEKPFINEIKGVKYFASKYFGFWYLPTYLIIEVFLLLRILYFGVTLNFVRARAYFRAL